MKRKTLSQNFSEEAYSALLLNGIIIGMCPLSVSPSRTAICPINPRFLPQVRIRTNIKSFGKLRFPPNKDVKMPNLLIYISCLPVVYVV